MEMILPFEQSGSPPAASRPVQDTDPGSMAPAVQARLPLEALVHTTREDKCCAQVQAVLDKATQQEVGAAVRSAAEFLERATKSSPILHPTDSHWERLSKLIQVKWLKSGYHCVGGVAAANARSQAVLLLQEHKLLLDSLRKTESEAKLRLDRLLNEMWAHVPVSSSGLRMIRLQHRITISSRLYLDAERHTRHCCRRLDELETLCAELCSKAARTRPVAFALVPCVRDRTTSLRCNEQLNFL